MIKSSHQEHCRHCGKPLRKATCYVRFVEEKQYAGVASAFGRSLILPKDQRPKTKAECQRLTNLQVVSVKRGMIYDNDYNMSRNPHIEGFGEWDGESYESTARYFCKNECAMDHGRLAVDARGLVTLAYKEATKHKATK